ncbi:HAD family hydrolase [Clostridium sp. LBM24168]
MTNLKCIMFDCMETLIDMIELPDKEDYARWAFDGSGCEKYFKDFDEFYKYYKTAAKCILDRMPDYREYSFKEQYEYIVREKGLDSIEQKEIVELLLKNYWQNYKRRCYADKMVKETLDYLSGKYKLGVVSNFKVKGGIGDLLEYTGIRSYFKFIVNSAEEGWRKPHPQIYMDAGKISGFISDEILFIGDDFVNDYLGPQKVGIESIFFDRKKRISEECRSINEFIELKNIL